MPLSGSLTPMSCPEHTGRGASRQVAEGLQVAREDGESLWLTNRALSR
jgi:hypothetical protein